jgi:hypothetical protein
LNANEFLYLINSMRYLRYMPRNVYAGHVSSILRRPRTLQAAVINRLLRIKGGSAQRLQG